MNVNGQAGLELQSATTVYSQEMVEGEDEDSNANTSLTTMAATSHAAPPACRIYKFAPKYGFTDTEDDMLIFLTKKLNVKTDGGQSTSLDQSDKTSSFFVIARVALQVRFECEKSYGLWSETVTDIDTIDRMISFKIPALPFTINAMMPVNVTLSQNDLLLASLAFFYLPSRK